MFINKILESRMFQVRSQQNYSTLRTQESGVPQGSTINVTIFAIKINSLSRVIPRQIQVSVFVDYVQIAYLPHDLNKVQRVLHESVNSIAN